MGKARVYARARQKETTTKAKKGVSKKGKKEFEEKPDSLPINTEFSVCKNCGFRAAYKFHRCPSCDAVQE
ncbi:hypothetical protein ACFLQN_01525 [Candidatus Aenigmatarchaeota archaeon]